MVLRGPGLSDVYARTFGPSHDDSVVDEVLDVSMSASWPRDTFVVLNRPTAMCAGHSTASSATAVLPFSAVHSSPTSLALRGPDSRAPRPTALYRPDPRHVCAAAFTADTAAQADPVVRRVLSLGGPSPELSVWRTFARMSPTTDAANHTPAISLDLGRPTSSRRHHSQALRCYIAHCIL